MKNRIKFIKKQLDITPSAAALCFVLFSFFSASAQLPMGGWRTHFSYNNVSEVALSPERVFALSDGSLFSVEKSTDLIETYSKVNALNSEQVAKIRYDEAQKLLFVAYADGNIDLLTENGTHNLPDVKDKVVSADKTPSDVCFRDGFAYLCNGIGIVVINLQKREVADTYVVGYNSDYVPVRTVKFLGDSIFAVTQDTLYSALATNRFLSSFEQWQRRKPQPQDAEIITPNTHKRVFDARENMYWEAGGSDGLLKIAADGVTVIGHYKPDGPANNGTRLLTFAGGRLFASNAVARHDGQPDITGTFTIFENESWKNITEKEVPKFRRLSYFAIDPNDAQHYFVSSYVNGLFEFRGDKLVEHSFAVPDWQYFSGLTFDKNHHLWMNRDFTGAAHLPNNYRTVKVKLNSGSYIDLDYPDISKNIWFGDIYTTSNNFKWFLLPHENNNAGVFVLDDRNDPLARSTHRPRRFGTVIDQQGNSIIFSFVRAFAEDKEGDVWIGHAKGIVVFRNINDVFTSNYQVHRPLIPRRDGTDLADFLLDNQAIYSIAVDGANRKWIGTETSGVFLVSADGLETIEHFTVENSPLLSNRVFAIAINPKTGEVFFATDKGLISYQSDAADSEEEFSKATFTAYPNPVRENFTGRITMEGFMNNSTVEVTDAAGNLVYKTKSNGRIATWDGKNAAGKPASAGVYFVIGISEDGKKSGVTKILIIR